MLNMARMLLGLGVWFAFSAASAQLHGYDEIFDEHGKVRAHYRTIYRAWESIPQEKRDRLFERSKKAFKGDNYLETLPRVIDSTDFDNILKPGIEQRAKALRLFLIDHYSGKKDYLRYGIVPQTVVRRALTKSSELGYDGKLDPQNIAFIYGPDIIRDEKGIWRVIEDNPGFVGLLGDLKLAYDVLADVYPEFKSINHSNPQGFYDELAAIFKERAAKHGGRVVMYWMPGYSDKEDSRLKEIFLKYGVAMVTPRSVNQLKFTPSGVYIYNTKRGFEASKEKVGFLFVQGEHEDIDPSYFEVTKKLILEEARFQVENMEKRGRYPELSHRIRGILEKIDEKTGEIDFKKLIRVMKTEGLDIYLEKALAKKRNMQGFTKSIVEGKVGSSYSPGSEFIGDKELYMYVPKFIRYYLGEEPILKNIETDSFADPVTGELNKGQFQEVFQDIKNRVIKPTDGRGGAGIVIGPYASREEIETAEKKVAAEPGNFIFQKVLSLSHLRNLIVDIRGFAFIDSNGVWVGDNMASRGLPMDRDENGKLKGNGKVNLSDQGREVFVMVNRGPVNRCLALF